MRKSNLRRALLVGTVLVLLPVLLMIESNNSSHSQEVTGGSPSADLTSPAQTFTVTSTGDSGAGTLRQAITDANATVGLDTIAFNIAGSGIQFVFVPSPLPTITDPVIIDGTTQPGYAGTPLIHLEGLGTGQALNITGGGSTIKGLSFTSFFAGATNGMIRISGTGNNVVTGCSFGVRGDSTRPTTASIGVLIDGSSSNRVGGATAAERNYFAVTSETGLVIQNAASGNRATGNWFGTGPNGTRMASTGRDEIRIVNSPNNTIGGSAGTTPGGACTGECNVIAGAGNNGVFINGAAATGNRVIGNFVGLFAAGTSVNANNLGIRIENAPGNLVGGTTAAERNVITGNSGLAGVMVTGAGSTGSVITGNYIGVFSGGTSAPPTGNSLDGILLNAASSGTRIGGATPGERNVISGLAGNGIEIAASPGNSVFGNYIGTDATGMVRSTTVGSGILVAFSDNNTIGGIQGTSPGGACTGSCNVISGNGNNGAGDGITLNTANGNSIDVNRIGINVAGTAAMLNGLTPDGNTFNGAAIRFLNSNNNIVGHASRVFPSAAAAPECKAQDPLNGNFVIADFGSGVNQVGACPGPLLGSGTGYTTNPLAGLTTLSPAYMPDGPFINRLYGESSFNNLVFGAKWRWTGPTNPFSFGLIAFYRWYGDQSDFAAFNCLCPTDDLLDGAGPFIFEGPEGSSSNQMLNIISGLDPTERNALPGLHPYIPFQTNQFSQNNKFNGSRTYTPGGGATFKFRGTGNSFDRFNGIGPRPRTNSPGGEIGDFGFGSFVSGRLVTSPSANLTYILNATATGLPPNSTFDVHVYGSSPISQPFLDIGVEVFYEMLQHRFPVAPWSSNGSGNSSNSQTISGLNGADLNNETWVRIVAFQRATNPGPDGPAVTGTVVKISDPILVPHAPNDHDGDGRTDIAVVRPGPGSPPSTWYILNSLDNSVRVAQFGVAEDRIVPGDYQGDRKWDLAVFRPSTGTWYAARPVGPPAQNFDARQFGIASDVPVAGDFDGDGRSDTAVFRSGTWWINESLSGNTITQAFGTGTDKPVPADYNGDGRTDVAIYRNGQWWISVCPSCAVRVDTWGLATDVPVPGDYDGDGKADLAVWRPSDGIWYIVKSTGGFVGYQWGTAGDKPVNGDFDGDGMNDIAVWRPSNGTWYIIKSNGGGFLGFIWGQNGDIPVPAFPNAP